MQLTGKTALVTGGQKSIGLAISLTLAQAGAEVYATSRTEHAYDPSLAELGIHPSLLDVTQPHPASYEFDILINNAGITAGRSIARTSEDQWQEVLDTNLSGAWRLMSLCLPYMITKHWGRIVNVASVVGMDGRLGPATYSASKAGLIGLTKTAAHESARKGITVNAVAPGFIGNTGMMGSLPTRVSDAVVESIPMGRLGTTQDVADAVLYLINAPYVTGHVLNVSGGYLT